MNLNWNNFYHAFQYPSFGVTLPNGMNYSSFPHYEAIKEIDLYHQPLERPSIVLTFFIVKLILIFLGEKICITLLRSLKKEKGVLMEVTKLFIVVQMILHPTSHFIELIVNTIHPVNQIFGNWICFFVWSL